MKKQRYWGLATLATLWVFISIIAGAAVGQTGTSAITVLWFLVAIYAATGNISAILKTAKFVLVLQVALGSIFLLLLSGDTRMQMSLGTPAEFAFGLGISLAAWGVLYLWAKDKNSTQENEHVRSKKNKYSPSQSGNLQNPKSEATAALASKPISKFENPNLRGLNDPISGAAPQNDAEIPSDTPHSRNRKITNNYNSTDYHQQKSTEKQQEEIKILLEHDDDVRAMIDEVSGLPLEVKQNILLDVLDNPDKDIIDLRNASILQALGRPDLEWNNDLEFTVSRFKTSDPENVAQFFKGGCPDEC